MSIINKYWSFDAVKTLILNIKKVNSQKQLLYLVNKQRKIKISLRALQYKINTLGINKRWSGTHPCIFFDRSVRKWTAFAIDDNSLQIKKLGYFETEGEALKALNVFTFSTD